MKTRRDIFGGLMLAAAALVCLTGCKKDDEGEKITLGVDFEQTAGMQKTYVGNGDKTIYWNTEDQVKVNDDEYTVKEGAVEVKLNKDGYAAVYPKTATLNGTGNACTGGTVVIPATQEYTVDANGVQRLDAPMAARLDAKTGRLMFRNLYAVIKVTVKAKETEAFTLNSITVESSENIAGTQEFSFNGKPTNEAAPTLGNLTEGSGRTCVTLTDINSTIPANATASFYLYTVPFTGANLTVRLNGSLTDENSHERSGIDIARSQLRGTDFNVDGATAGYVDLGLSVLWATCNVGAASPKEPGCYFAWGETLQKDAYNWTAYNYGSSASNLTKYTGSDGLSVLQSIDDAVTANWGSGWRMPTKAEMDELFTKCDIEYQETDKVYKVSNKLDASKYILLPAGGYREDNATKDITYAYYWTSTLSEESSKAWRLCLTPISSSSNIGFRERYKGYNVRPVMPMPTE